ncbi:MAG: ribbon-helix-helix protein, CopG family [Desulfuromonadaceae bacterium]|nr:ribbon-helix-helix protein, CopG family [Desulfuromonadaceae bacterium]
MARMKEFPRHKVISMRITDEEFKRLEFLIENTHQSVSNIMREAVEHFAENYERTKSIRPAKRLRI